jgi:hypothetical protein
VAASSLIAVTGPSYEEATQTLRAMAERATSRRKAEEGRTLLGVRCVTSPRSARNQAFMNTAESGPYGAVAGMPTIAVCRADHLFSRLSRASRWKSGRMKR